MLEVLIMNFRLSRANTEMVDIFFTLLAHVRDKAPSGHAFAPLWTDDTAMHIRSRTRTKGHSALDLCQVLAISKADLIQLPSCREHIS
jgi:hypothetical protein